MNKVTRSLVCVIYFCLAMEVVFWLNNGKNKAVWSMWFGGAAVTVLLIAAITHIVPKIAERWSRSK